MQSLTKKLAQNVQARRNQHLTCPSEYLYASTSTNMCKRIRIKLHINIYIYATINAYKKVSCICTTSYKYIRTAIYERSFG